MVQFHDPTGFCSTYGASKEATPAAAYALTSFATSFANDCFANLGPTGVAFDASGNLLAANYADGYLYRFGSEGGAADFAHRVGYVEGAIGGIAFTKDGRLYASLKGTGRVVELNPSTAAILRTVVDVPGATALAVDPLSGDLFTDDYGNVYRITNFANGPGTLSGYLATGAADGITFGADGTLYLKAGSGIYKVTGTDKPQPASYTLVTNLPGFPDGVALQPNPGDATKPFLYVNRNDGTLTKVDTTGDPPVLTDVFTAGSRGDFVTVGP